MTIRRKPNRPRPPEVQPWMLRWVLWTSRGGLKHVASRADTLASGVLTTTLCGKNGMSVETSNWWAQSVKRGYQVCSECQARLAAGQIGQEKTDG